MNPPPTLRTINYSCVPSLCLISCISIPIVTIVQKEWMYWGHFCTHPSFAFLISYKITLSHVYISLNKIYFSFWALQKWHYTICQYFPTSSYLGIHWTQKYGTVPWDKCYLCPAKRLWSLQLLFTPELRGLIC